MLSLSLLSWIISFIHFICLFYTNILPFCCCFILLRHIERHQHVADRVHHQKSWSITFTLWPQLSRCYLSITADQSVSRWVTRPRNESWLYPFPWRSAWFLFFHIKTSSLLTRRSTHLIFSLRSFNCWRFDETSWLTVTVALSQLTIIIIRVSRLCQPIPRTYILKKLDGRCLLFSFGMLDQSGLGSGSDGQFLFSPVINWLNNLCSVFISKPATELQCQQYGEKYGSRLMFWSITTVQTTFPVKLRFLMTFILLPHTHKMNRNGPRRHVIGFRSHHNIQTALTVLAGRLNQTCSGGV